MRPPALRARCGATPLRAQSGNPQLPARRIPPARPGPSRPSPRPSPPLPLTSHDVQGQGHQEAEPGAAGPPGNRCCEPRHPAAHPFRGGRGLGGRPRWPPPARHLPRPLRAAPTPPAGSPPPPARPPVRSRSSQTMEREPEQEGGRERARHTGCPSAPPGPSALRIPKPRAPPCLRSGRRPLPWGLICLTKRASRRSAGSLSEAPAPGANSHFLCLMPAPQATHL